MNLDDEELSVLIAHALPNTFPFLLRNHRRITFYYFSSERFFYCEEDTGLRRIS